MPIDNLLEQLNPSQREATTFSGMHALVLAGAGTGKTRTIIARAAYLIHSGIPSDRIQVLTFTRRSAREIVERVKTTLGDRAGGLKASTFHTWCMSLIRSMPKLFGCDGHTVIDRDDQVNLFKILRGTHTTKSLPTAAVLCNIYSYARNTRTSLTTTLEKHYNEELSNKSRIADTIVAYESKKKTRRYLDYDDILDIVATVFKNDMQVRDHVARQYDHLLVDEMQDTNPLQWELLKPLCDSVKLFCVGDDAQSIYGFRGADFRNIHNFTERVSNATTFKLEHNYRSTQEILDLSNWLLEQSHLQYNKRLIAVRGTGQKPRLLEFATEWEEGRWIAEDIARRRDEGADWGRHMILTRSGFAARAVETCLLARNIPYVVIGGVKLLDAAHVRDVLSLLRIVANPFDELAWMRYLTLWPGVGDVKANQVIEGLPESGDISAFADSLKRSERLPKECKDTFDIVAALASNVTEAFRAAREAMRPILEHIYSKDWTKRTGDLELVDKLVRKHTSILAFIEEYLLDPVHGSAVDRTDNADVVSIVTIHSAKGTEKPVCYVINVSPGSFPMTQTLDNADEVEEERRVLYVALTRAQDELILTRRYYSTWASEKTRVLPTNNQYRELNDALQELRVSEAKIVEAIANQKPSSRNSKKKKLLDEELKTVRRKIKRAINALSEKSSQIEPSASEAPDVRYFLNGLPSELISSELPENGRGFTNSPNTLSARARPDVGIDLS